MIGASRRNGVFVVVIQRPAADMSGEDSRAAGQPIDGPAAARASSDCGLDLTSTRGAFSVHARPDIMLHARVDFNRSMGVFLQVQYAACQMQPE